ncbi:hypothetical protein PACTADRAFT_35145 [Pachysolen tannophilus NRRL Y-2460]|uniref:Golgi to ER traffic protein 2 n=1 Tax=Pachysolen tannophilus NRRL Y-2460 TaxID=669874 RepID=A0A1E4TRH3_PACTA|nr:hypothetical protein PACTADRAFT_35145 [Pachysolen tannophilus NRRL Y-2460]
MSELSEAEKRKILRERRAAKLAKGGGTDRLNKITGINGPAFSNKTTSFEENENQRVEEIDSKDDNQNKDKVAEINTGSVVGNVGKDANYLENEDDPENSDITELGMGAGLHQQQQQQQQQQQLDIDKLLQEMFMNSSAANHQHHHQDNDGDPLLNDPLFSKFLSTLKGDENEQQQQQQEQLSAEEIKKRQALQQKLLLNFKKFKYRFLIVRFLIIVSLLFYSFFNENLYESSLIFNYSNQKSNFYIYFLTLELGFAIFYMIFIDNNEKNNIDSIIVKTLNLIGGFIPQKYKKLLLLLAKYQEMINFFLNDLSIVILFFGISSVLI